MPKTRLSGSRIRALRLQRRMRQADLARQADISPSYLNLIEHNRRKAGPKLLAAIAQALQVLPDALDERAGDAVVEALQAIAAQVTAAPFAQGAGLPGAGGSARTPVAEPELDRVDELVGRFPGWAGLLEHIGGRSQELERLIGRMSDRMAHDPNLSAALHEIVSAVTAVQSTSAILTEAEDLEPEWRAKFDANIFNDSKRLAQAAEALVAFLDTSGEETGLAAPQEELESWLERQGYHVAALESAQRPDLEALIEDQAELATQSARSLARAWLAQAWEDAQALPLAELLPDVTKMLEQSARSPSEARGLQPELLAQKFGCSLPTLFRRLASLPPHTGVARFGLALCDGSGTLIYRRPIEGFVLPRFGGACPLWPLYQALAQPNRPLRAQIEFAGRPPVTFQAFAVSQARNPNAFDMPPIYQAAMLVTPVGAALEDPAGDTQVLGVGSSCRICPRDPCPARREPSIVGG